MWHPGTRVLDQHRAQSELHFQFPDLLDGDIIPNSEIGHYKAIYVHKEPM